MDFIDDIIKREGGLTNDPLDPGGRTDKGISARSNPEAWKDGKVTEEEARAIYEAKYFKGPGFDKVPDPTLQAQLTDFGVLSGPAVAIRNLQTILGCHPDGVLGPETLLALSTANLRVVNNHLVAARVRMICRLVQANPPQLRFLLGWADRSLQFLA